MVEWKLQTRRTRNPGGDPRGVAVTVDDRGALRLRHRPVGTAVTPQRTYAYRITSPADMTLDAAALSSGAGEGIDLPRVLAALTSFRLADAGRYDHAHRHAGEAEDAKRVGADLREHREVSR